MDAEKLQQRECRNDDLPSDPHDVGRPSPLPHQPIRDGAAHAQDRTRRDDVQRRWQLLLLDLSTRAALDNLRLLPLPTQISVSGGGDALRLRSSARPPRRQANGTASRNWVNIEEREFLFGHGHSDRIELVPDSAGHSEVVPVVPVLDVVVAMTLLAGGQDVPLVPRETFVEGVAVVGVVAQLDRNTSRSARSSVREASLRPRVDGRRRATFWVTARSRSCGRVVRR